MVIGMYVVYFTIYSGDKLPPYYIGSTSKQNVESGYYGSVRSKKYKSIWESELKLNPHLFDIIILEECDTRQNALYLELKYQKLHNIVKNEMFINMAYASPNGFYGRDTKGENNPMYGVKHSSETIERIRNINIGKKRSTESIEKQRISISGENNPMHGKQRTEEVKAKIRESRRGILHTDESKQKMSVIHSGENNGFYGKKHTEDAKRKMKGARKSTVSKCDFWTDNSLKYMIYTLWVEHKNIRGKWLKELKTLGYEYSKADIRRLRYEFEHNGFIKYE